MMYQLNRHLEIEPDPREPEKILFTNLLYGTRFLADSDVWEALGPYTHPRELGDSDLEKRANAANVLSPSGVPSPPSSFLKDFDSISRQVLEYLKVTPSEDIFQRMDQLTEHCKPIGKIIRKAYFIWDDTTHVFKVLLDHIKVYLQQEFERPETSNYSVDFLQSSLGRPRCLEKYEQQTCSLETSWNKAELLARSFPPPSRVLILGDDDLISLALQHFPSAEIDVFEIDPVLIRHLKKSNRGQIRFHRRDLTKGLPAEFREKYDVVVTDPMYEASGMTMFINCCAQGLTKNPNSRLFISTYPPLLEKPGLFFQDIERNELQIKGTSENFNRYPFPAEMKAYWLETLVGLGYDSKLIKTMLSIPYLYSHLYTCGWSKS